MEKLIEELQKRILELENRKKEIEDLIPWRQNEMPKFGKELEGLKLSLHEMRAELDGLKKSTAPASADRSDEPFFGFFGIGG